MKEYAISLKDKFLDPILLNEQEIYLTVSIGFSMSNPTLKNEKKTASSMIDDAESAMMRVNEIGGDGWEIFNHVEE